MPSTSDLTGAGLPPLLATLLGPLANGTYVQGINTTGTIQNLLGIDPSNNLVLDTIGNITFATNGSTKWFLANGGLLQTNDVTSGLAFKTGSNARTGTFTLNGATPVVVSNTSLLSNDRIIIVRDTVAGTPGAFNLTARTNGASFSVTGTAGDTSGCAYFLIRTV